MFCHEEFAILSIESFSLAILFSSPYEAAEIYMLFSFISCISFVCLCICCRKGYFASRVCGGRLVQILLGYKFRLLKCLEDEPLL